MDPSDRDEKRTDEVSERVAEQPVFLAPDDSRHPLLDEEIRQAAEHAAARAGLSLNDWVTRAIRKSVTEELGDVTLPVPEPAAATEALPTGSRSGTDLEAIQDLLAQQFARQTEELRELLAEKQDVSTPPDTGYQERLARVEIPEIQVTQEDLGEIHTLLHEYFGVLLPATQQIETVMQQLDVLLDRTVDFRDLNAFLTDLAANSERTVSTLLPLQRAVARLAGPNNNDDLVPGNEPRPLHGGSGIARLFRSNE